MHSGPTQLTALVSLHSLHYNVLPHSIFLVDHAWTFQADCARKQLQLINGLAVRMAALMGLGEGPDGGSEEEEEGEGSYDADSESGKYEMYL